MTLCAVHTKVYGSLTALMRRSPHGSLGESYTQANETEIKLLFPLNHLKGSEVALKPTIAFREVSHLGTSVEPYLGQTGGTASLTPASSHKRSLTQLQEAQAFLAPELGLLPPRGRHCGALLV